MGGDWDNYNRPTIKKKKKKKQACGREVTCLESLSYQQLNTDLSDASATTRLGTALHTLNSTCLMWRRTMIPLTKHPKNTDLYVPQILLSYPQDCAENKCI